MRKPHGLPPLLPSGSAEPWKARVSLTRIAAVEGEAAAVLEAVDLGQPCGALAAASC